MKISLLIPTMNRPEELRRNLKSVFSGGVLPYEIIVSDDSDPEISKDIKKIVKEFSGVKYITGPRIGISGNINNLIKHAKGDFFVFLGDDNMVDKDYFKNMVICYHKYSKIYGKNIIITGKEIRNGEEVIPGEITFLGYQAKKTKDYTRVKANVECSTLFPANLFKYVKYDEALYYGSNEIDVVYQALYYRYRIIFCPEIVNIHKHSSINRNKYESSIEMNRIYETLKIYGIYDRNIWKFISFGIIAPIHILLYFVRHRRLSYKNVSNIFKSYKMFLNFYNKWKKHIKMY